MGERLARQHVNIDTGMVLLESLAEDYVSSLRESGLREGEAWRVQHGVPKRWRSRGLVFSLSES
jgi:hypothetical protein